MHGHVHGQTTAVGSFTRVPRLNAHGLMPNSILLTILRVHGVPMLSSEKDDACTGSGHL